MTKEEIKDLIDNTINENGVKAITGKALNLALNEIVDMDAESTAKTVYVGSNESPLTEEQIASNIALYNEISTALSNGKIPTQVNGIAYSYEIEGNVGFWSDLITMQESSIMIICAYILIVTLSSDGSVTVNFGG